MQFAILLLLPSCDGKPPPPPRQTTDLEPIRLPPERKHEEQAIHLLQQKLKKDPGDVALRMALVEKLLDVDLFDEAERQCRLVLVKSPDHEDANFDLGIICLSTGRPQQAIAHFTKTIEKNPDRALAHAYLGQIELERGDPEAARRHLEAARERAPRHPKVQYTLGRLALDEGRLDEAIVHFREAVATDPLYLPARYNLARTLIRAGHEEEGNRELARYDEVRAQVRRMQNLDYLGALGDDPVTQSLKLAQYYASIQNHREAMKELDRALASSPDDPRPYVAAHRLARERGDVAEAETLLRRGLERCGRLPELLAALGRLHLEVEALKDHATALSLAKEAFEAVDGRDPRIAELLGRARLEAGDRHGAIEAVERGLAVSPGDTALRELLESMKGKEKRRRR